MKFITKMCSFLCATVCAIGLIGCASEPTDPDQPYLDAIDYFSSETFDSEEKIINALVENKRWIDDIFSPFFINSPRDSMEWEASKAVYLNESIENYISDLSNRFIQAMYDNDNFTCRETYYFVNNILKKDDAKKEKYRTAIDMFALKWGSHFVPFGYLYDYRSYNGSEAVESDFTYAIKPKLRDPDSLVIYNITTYIANFDETEYLFPSTPYPVCFVIDYGAKNGFGGMVRSTASAHWNNGYFYLDNTTNGSAPTREHYW